MKIEEHYGFPQDIEYAVERGNLYIVQSRPITTLDKGKQGESKEIKPEFVPQETKKQT